MAEIEMHEPDAPADPGALVPGSHRLIRAVDAAEGPFAGTLVAGDESPVVAVDVARLSDWPGWAFSGAEHLCGVLDVRRRVDGHDALLPWCTQRVETFLGRRLVAEDPLSPGELGTLVASLLRGLREISETAADAGDWWITGDGRPLFVHGEGGAARARTAALVARVAEHTADRTTARVLDEITAALRERRHHVVDDAQWEEQLFAIAAPRALRLDVFAPERAKDVAARRALRPVPVDGRRARRVRSAPAGRRPRWALGGAVLATLRERIAPWRVRLPRSRRRPLILAGSLAALVLVAGLMWPDGEKTEQAQAAPRESTPATPVTPPALSEAGAEVAPETAEPLSVVPSLLETIAACVDSASEACPDAMSEGLSTPGTGLVADGSAASAASLVDDYGDVVVVKLTPTDEAAAHTPQMLVLERWNEKWLVRDVYDVAHQPG